MGKIISFSNKKGGVGKTTTAINMAAYCADLGKKVLLVDIDSQGNATTGLGFSKSALKKSVYNVLIEDDNAASNILPTQVKLLDILPANVDLTGAEVDLVYKKNREQILKTALEKIRGEYDYIFIDCPPSLGLLTINAWVASDSVIIPLQSEYYALEGVSQLMNTIAMVRQHLNPVAARKFFKLAAFSCAKCLDFASLRKRTTANAEVVEALAAALLTSMLYKGCLDYSVHL